ncbi:hypothetical protein [Corallococcus sp. AS-1-12]|uniref:hypothetical protein n=1 Tax=Corallococcus sp. AS-1-12 TaxID=2874598 RepID=UPI001CC10BF6|nr:hypothetical protein [Corallococcus sp. AS-1-12]MBZ4333754.1 hypothetical protein [Corallococcus sp. AS-1-12]
MPNNPPADFSRISPHGGAQTAAFEEFCSQLARHADIPNGSVYQRNGHGADLGVECIWHLPDGTKWGWQAKFVFDLDALKSQVNESFESALKGHPNLTHYYICFPFQPSAAPGKGKSQQEKLEKYKSTWESTAEKQGRKVTITFWPASELTDRLINIDTNGGRRLFWFENTALTPAWFKQHISNALKFAEPRYTPKLTVKHALSPILDALGSTPRWDLRLSEWRIALNNRRESWEQSLALASATALPEFPETLLPSGRLLQRKIDQIIVECSAELRSPRWEELRRFTSEARAAQLPLQDGLRTALDATHGDGASQSKRFRQFQAEYQARFPAQHYDSLQELSNTLLAFTQWLDSVEVKANSENLLLITGAAGIGKTHSLCDVAATRSDSNFFSILLFGDRFRSGMLWDQIRLQLGLGGNWSEDALFDALETAAEATGRPLIIFIDAINESQPRTFWRSELGALIQNINKRQNLRLCITCRSDYATKIISHSLKIPSFNHPGFAGYEFNACQSFFTHYKLEPPIGPLFDSEFSNPLFLKLTCEALRARNLRRLPTGWSGFRTIFRTILEQHDRDWQTATESLVHNAITRTMESLAAELARRSRRSISLTEASALISTIGIDADSILKRLLENHLLMRVPAPVSNDNSLLSETQDEIAFAYERLGDHLQVQATLRRTTHEPLSPEIVQLALSEPGYAASASGLAAAPERSLTLPSFALSALLA